MGRKSNAQIEAEKRAEEMAKETEKTTSEETTETEKKEEAEISFKLPRSIVWKGRISSMGSDLKIKESEIEDFKKRFPSIKIEE